MSTTVTAPPVRVTPEEALQDHSVRQLVYGEARRRCRNEQDRLDLTQEGWVAVLRELRAYDPRHPSGRTLGSWCLRRIRCAMGLYQRRAGRLARAQDFQLEELADPAPGRAAEAAERRDLAEGLLRFLPPREGELLRLRYLRGLTESEAGRVLGFSHARAGQLEARALGALRQRTARPPWDELAPGIPAPAAPPPPPAPGECEDAAHFLKRTYLGADERAIVKALAGGPLRWSVVCRLTRAGTTRVKLLLSALVRRGILRVGPSGYEVTSPIVLQTLRDLQAEEAGA